MKTAETVKHRLIAKSFEFEDCDGVKHSPWLTLEDAINILTEYASQPQTEQDKKTVLRIVDSCFHAYASSYRNDAKTMASELYDKINLKSTPSEQKPMDELEKNGFSFETGV